MRTRFAERLKALMTLHNISQNELARRIGVTPPQVAKYLSGADSPPLPRLELIADQFPGVTLDNLVGRTPSEPRSETSRSGGE